MAKCLIPVAIWILISGLDDLFIALVSLWTRRDPFPWPEPADLERARERRIAIFVPLWQEHRVIGQMLERNLTSIHYSNYDVFVGVYPNDPLTERAVREAASRDPRIHPVEVPHAGPTSKGDCLNWIHEGLLQFEVRYAVRFEIVVTHDAEDLIHPESLRLINWYSRDFQMIQIPVLALPTKLHELTHGLYCDEFAEFQSKDIPVRRKLGGFLPGNGVGTGFERRALERLAAAREGRIFDPACLTEDYENGLRLYLLGYRQLFVPLRFTAAGPVATREYFPRSLRAAVRQRSRWVSGIALQGWEHYGWRVPARQIYWFWRDRKGLVGNLLSPGANLLYLYGLCGHDVWAQVPRLAAAVCAATLLVTLIQVGIRMGASRRVYGMRFASLVPLRMLYGNLVNYLATVAALRQFFRARLRRQRLSWHKTEHTRLVHPSACLGKPRIGELLVRLRAVSPEVVEKAAASQPLGMRIGEHLLNLQYITEENLYRALSVQAGVPLGTPPAQTVDRQVAHVLPAEAMRRWKVLPYRVDLGQLHLMTAEPPTDAMIRELAMFSTLEPRFRLVRPAEFRRMERKYLR